MTNVIMLCHNRLRLLQQALRTLYDNTPREEFTLTLVNDASTDFRVNRALEDWAQAGNATLLTINKSAHVLARGKNLGAFWSEQSFGRGEWLMLCDNDIAFFPGWLDRMLNVFKQMPTIPYIVGGNQHPYHKTNKDWEIFHETDAVAGYSMFMNWTTWDSFGPFPRTGAPGVGQSEDFQLSRLIVDKGGTVGYVHPPVLAHCGITNTDGKPAVGAAEFVRVPGVLYE